MTSYIAAMSRIEMKYILDQEQTELFKKSLQGHMKVDQYGLTSIASLYFDTPDYRLIRTSIEKPAFKEKIRLRSYGMASDSSPVFLELKRKANGIVYKRRVQTTIPEIEAFFDHDSAICADGQIAREISYFRNYYGTLIPSCLIIYDRLAYKEDNGDLRLTIDANPRYRVEKLNLTTSMEGTHLLSEGYTILEIKVQEAMPLWLSRILDELKIYVSSFSKYGTAYTIETKKQLAQERSKAIWKTYSRPSIQTA